MALKCVFALSTALTFLGCSHHRQEGINGSDLKAHNPMRDTALKSAQDSKKSEGEEMNSPRNPIDISKLYTSDWSKSMEKMIPVIGYCLYPQDPYTSGDVADAHIMMEFDLRGYGPVTLVQGRLSNNFPASMPSDFCVLVSDEKKEAFPIWIDKGRPIRTWASDSSALLGGTEFIPQGVGWFKCFAVVKGQLRSVFTSHEPTSNYSLGNPTDGCANYVGGDLSFKNYDIDGDGCMDLEFSGTKRIYCTKELLIDSDKPIKLEKVKFVYLYSRSADSKDSYIKR